MNVLKMALVGMLCFVMHAHAYPTSVPIEAIQKVATPDNISEDKLKDKLIGTWQCTYRSYDVDHEAKLIFMPDGKLISQINYVIKDPIIGTAVVHTHRDWRVFDNSGMWILAEQVAQVTRFEVSDLLQSQLTLKSYLDKSLVTESVMSFDEKDGQQRLTRLNGAWGFLLGECIKESDK